MKTFAAAKCSTVLATVASLALVGCGEGDAGNGAGDAPAATSEATVTATVTVTATPTATETVTETASPSASDSPRPRGCGQVGFEPGTDAGAFDIRASGVGCQVAREVAAAAEGQGGRAYGAGQGFECTPAGTVGELPSVLYECTREGGGTISFQVS